MPSDCTVAMADRGCLPLGRWASLLSPREQAEASTYARPDRRRRTIASRVLTKYLVVQCGPRQFQWVGARDIVALDHSELASVELLTGEAQARKGPIVVRSGHRCCDVSASISHCGRYTASCIGSHRLGLDLERIQPRRREFYHHTFSCQERDWVMNINAKDTTLIDAAFTLLWSVKEAFLKASGRNDLTLWSFPRLTVRLDEGIHQVLRPNSHHEELRIISGAIGGPGFLHTVEIAAMRVGDMILAAIQY
ncbi:MAG TPA: 4'-phosphopantetheinyl transferase superfamily protein [Blastocatellia bacterium]